MEPLRITEILANPKGTDRGNEWVELCAGPEPVSLNAYVLQVGTRRLALSGAIPAASCRIARTGTAAIRNREADIALTQNGRVVQAAHTAGDAPEGRGFHVTDAGSFWASSTPGIAEGTPPALPPLPAIPEASLLTGIVGTAACTAGILTLTASIALRHARTRHHELP